MMFVLSKKSSDRLAGVHPDLVAIVRHAIGHSAQDFSVLEGVRSAEQCYTNWGKGRTMSQCKAAGVPVGYARPTDAKVTWLKNPLNSKHCKHGDGFGHAVDLVPYPVDFNSHQKYAAIAIAMRDAAKALGVKMRWGGDWDGDGVQEKGEYDWGHFELI